MVRILKMVTWKMFTPTSVIGHSPLISLLISVYFLQFPLGLMRYLVMGRPRTHQLKVVLITCGVQGDADVTLRSTILLLDGFPDVTSLWFGTLSRLTAARSRFLVACITGCR